MGEAEDDDTDAEDLIDPTAVVGRRMAGWLIDTALVVAVFVLVLVVLGDSFERPGTDTDLEVRRFGSDTALMFRSTVAVIHTWEWLAAGAAAAGAILLFLVALPARRGWTPGLLAAELRLVDDEGAVVGLRSATVRFVGWIIDILPGVPLVGLAAMRFGRHHQRVGDRMAHTYVVDRSYTGRSPVEPAEAAPTAQVPELATESIPVEYPDAAASTLSEEATVRRRSRQEPPQDSTATEDPSASPTGAVDRAAPEAEVWAADGERTGQPSGPAPGAPSEEPGRTETGERAEAADADDPPDGRDPAGAPAPAADTPGPPPEGVVADQPQWDRTREQYLMWHGATGTWVAFDDSDKSWKPL